MQNNLEIIKFILAGCVNTLVGYIVFLLAYDIWQISAYRANLISYMIGVACAYLLNRFFVFQVTTSGVEVKRISKFIACFLLAFLVNQVVLYLVHEVLSITAEIAQIFAMVSYTIVFFILNKYIVFRR